MEIVRSFLSASSTATQHWLRCRGKGTLITMLIEVLADPPSLLGHINILILNFNMKCKMNSFEQLYLQKFIP